MSKVHVTPIRVLHVARSLGLGGTEKVLQLFVAHLDRTRFAPTVYAFSGGERAAQIRSQGIKTHIGGDLSRLLAELRPHIVHLHRAGWPEPDLMRLLRPRPPVVPKPIIVETNVFGRFDPSPAGKALDATLFVSRFCADRYAAENGIPTDPSQYHTGPPRYHVVYNPVDTDFFSSPGTPEPDFSRPVVGRLSRSDPGKWSNLALDILPILKRRVPGFRYRVVGGTDQARDFVRAHGLDDCVEFLDPLATDAELAGFMASISVLAHANDTGESFGLAIAEAMACGLPVVTHPAQGKRDNAQLELVDHGTTGLVAETVEDYARAVAWLLANPEQAMAMGLAGREKAARLYRAQTVTRQLEAIYLDLLAAKDLPAPGPASGEMA